MRQVWARQKSVLGVGRACRQRVDLQVWLRQVREAGLVGVTRGLRQLGVVQRSVMGG